MIAEWYLSRQLKALTETHSNFAIGSVESLLPLSKAEWLIFDSSLLFYEEQPLLTQYFAIENQEFDSKQVVLAKAASIAGKSSYPLYKALQIACHEAALLTREVEVDELNRSGLLAKIDRTWLILGDQKVLESEGIFPGVAALTLADQHQREGRSVIFLAQKQPKRLLGIFIFEHLLFDGVLETLAKLDEMKITPVLVTQENQLRIEAMRKQLGIEQIYSVKDAQIRKKFYESWQKERPSSCLISKKAKDTGGIFKLVLGRPSENTPWVLSTGDLISIFIASRKLLQKAQKYRFWFKLST